jgi:hypothetical protein
VIVRPIAGATATMGDVTLASVAHLRLSGIGGTLKSGSTHISGASHHDTLDHIVYTACVRFDGTRSSSHMLMNHDRLDNLGVGLAGCDMGEGRLQVEDGDVAGMRTGWLVISNSHFGGEGSDCSDGVQLGGDGVKVGPGNEFTGIYQRNCTTHADPIQVYGGQHSIITGNWFHDNGDGSGGLMAGFYSDYISVTNNVFVCDCIYPYSFYAGADRHILVQHNTFAGGGELHFEATNGVVPCCNSVKDNVFTSGGGITTDGSNYGTNSHNLNAGKPGTGNLTGKPIFVGGKKPTSYAGYRLAPRSRGKGAASDGGDMGIRPRR